MTLSHTPTVAGKCSILLVWKMLPNILVLLLRVFLYFLNLFHRNDLYVTLNSGEFERGGKSVGKNIEVLVLAMDADGHPLQVMT